jgi:23S rRNA maturation-related 3'-5' exoribonuclease YhaM
LKRYYLYLNEEQKIKSRNAQRCYICALKDKVSKCEILLYLMKKNKTSKCRDVVISFEKSTVNENRFLNACNRIHNCQNDDSETIKKKALFRRRKFDVLIEFI